jgi:uncharacterized repeat protein (TIGR02543 family)
MATVSKWTPFGVALDITATGGTVTRTSATQYTVKINVSWETYYSGAQTNYGMTAASGGVTHTISTFDGAKRSSGSGSFTGTYSISGNGSATKTITVTFRNFNTDNGDSATKNVTFNVTVPAWTSYSVKYNANGGSGAPSSQTKWKDQTLTLSSTKPTRAGHSFLGWSTSSTATTATYSAGGSYTANSAATLYAVWKANTYSVKYNANGGSGAPSNQTKTYGVTLKLSSTKPTRTNYNFKGWGTSASATTVAYAAGADYTTNAAATLYAIWELAYKKPTISNLSASRCNSSGIAQEDGTAARITFDWSSYLAVSSVKISWVDTSGSKAGNTTVTVSGTSGTASTVVTSATFDAETTYSFTVTVTDSGGSTSRSVTMSGIAFHIDLGQNSVSIGKPAETILDGNSKTVKAFDSNWLGLFRNHLCTGDKIYYHDGKQGIFLSSEGFMHLQRTTAQGNHPYIGFYLDNAKSSGGTIRLNSSTKLMEFLNAAGYRFGGDIIMNNNESIMGYDTSGASCNAFQAKNDSNNTIVGYGNYANASGNTNIYGNDINFGVANIANPSTYRPYRRQGDTFTLTLRTAGYVTNGGKDISFWIPMAEPIVGSPTVTVTSGSGFVLRQGDKYTHGSTASVNVKPDSYEATATMFNGIYVKAVFSDTTNVTNNDAIGIYWNGTVTFS